ncbi:Neutral/alkaline non-lysosomal ceramidase [Pirellula sp. SH-Sr6A]|uniref:neutral/alkaline non-lysosomal ceramidase N-terminal domain-containing protein n=1 Tax=Pirellula sp. SH-Sr6A TaxID=1632865 RepID=UPI00078CD56C|nr:neutral/alkaline non-lysosomal ceramidase N-terminal domain-containing protein [Pirellula sp. SH-Sr6A]AMV30947.1 Neutral/alkaline non-lysosomal ceramidase [Pirellula sp. SH-Sr6A]
MPDSHLRQVCRSHPALSKSLPFALSILLLAISFPIPAVTAAEKWLAGAAKEEITPTEPVRLSGYAVRTQSTSAVADPLHVRALYLEHSGSKPLMLVSLDAIGIAPAMTDQITAYAEREFKIARAEIAICTTHSHSAPHLDGAITNLYTVPQTPDEVEATKRYTAMVVEKTKAAMKGAWERRAAAIVQHGDDHAGFAKNRRNVKSASVVGSTESNDGPVDQTVRILKVTREDGSPLAVAFQYACHCTTISPDLNQVSADWAGLAATAIETDWKGAIALPIIGTGADANPNPRGSYENAKAHGKELADSVLRGLQSELKQVPAPTTVTFAYTGLEFERPSRNKLQEMLESKTYQERNFAKSMQDILKKKDRIPESYPAPAHLWTFGNELAWIFLGGEVVVDFQIRFERELNQFANVWVAAYTDDVFAYVASERVRSEGGYEVDSSMLYYNQPGRWVSGTEDKWVRAVLDLQRQKRSMEQPLSAEEGLRNIQVPTGWRVDQLAAEPLVEDPINVSFGPDGRVWIVEMGDYPSGGERRGRVKWLRDNDGDGTLDESHVFLDNLDFPAGVQAWRDGVIVACAPEVFFARDRDGDGKADERDVILSGFPETNPQHRVYGFTYGLDHRLYFGAGDGAREVLLHKLDGSTETVSVEGVDLALDPDRRTLTQESGETQFIRSQDAWGNWFGNNNSHPIYHFTIDRFWKEGNTPLPRSLYQYVTNPPSTPQVFPLSLPLDRFNDPYTANRFTSACSTIFNSSPGSGDGMQGAAIVCESVHNLVARFQMKPDGVSFKATRFPEDAQSEWVRSDDPWFRPVRVVNAPDGTVWVVDMYRRVIEHPTWIPEEWLARLDVRAGQDRGRLYRVYREDFKPAPLQNFHGMKRSTSEWIGLLGNDNQTVAEMAQQQMLWYAEERPELKDQLKMELRSAANAKARLRIFNMLHYLGALNDDDWATVLSAPEAGLVDYALRTVAREKLSRPGIDASLGLLCRREDVVSSPAHTKHLFLASLHSPAVQPAQLAELLALHTKVAGWDTLAIFVPDARVDTLTQALLNRSDVLLTKIVDRLMPRISTRMQSELVDTIRNYRGDRPAWHYLIAQRNRSNQKNAKQEELDLYARLKVDAKSALHSATANRDTRLAALDFYWNSLSEAETKERESLLELASTQSDQSFSDEILSRLLEQGKGYWSSMIQQSSPQSDWNQRVAATFLSRPKSALWWLDRAIAREISIDQILPSQIESLREQPDPEIKKRVLTLFGPDDRTNRQEIIASLIGNWPKETDRESGKALFLQHCAACHAERELGGEKIPAIGPPLTGLNHWTNDAWVTSIIDPSRSVDTKYKRVSYRTEDDEILSGLKVRETDQSIEIIGTDGRIRAIERSRIAEEKESNLSLMPDGFEKSLDAQQIANLIKYLRSSE